MPRIPMPDNIDPGAFRGDRNSPNAPDLGGPARALQGLGNALKGLSAQWSADQKRMDGYNANLALEKWSNQQAMGYQTDFDNAAPDGSDFLQTREKNLTESYSKIRTGIKDPELQAKADLIFEQTRGGQLIKGYGAVKEKRKSYVVATTNDGVTEAINAGQIQSGAQYNDYFENVVKPKIDSVVDDPLDRQKMYSAFGERLGVEFLKRNPQAALPRSGSLVPGLGEAIAGAAEVHGVSADYLSRLAMIESGGGRNMANPNSTARGPFQFITSTARAYGLSNAMDFRQGADAAARLTRDNHAALQKALGRNPTPGELYLAHQQGIGGAINLLSHPDDLAVSVVGEQAVKLNGGGPGMTARQFASKWINKFEGSSTAVAAAVPVSKPSGGMWDHVSDEQWLSAGRVAYAEQIQQQKVIEEAKRIADDELIKSGYDLIKDEALTPEWIEENRDALSPSEYRAFNTALTSQNKEGKTDPASYRTLFDQAANGDNQSEVQDDTFTAFSEGRISKTDFNKIFALSRSTEKHRTEKPWLNDIRSTLSSRLAPLDRDDTTQYTRRLDGLFALDDWVNANPDATRDEVKKKSNELAKEYSETVTADLRAKLDMPKYTTVGRYNVTSDSIAISAQKLAQAYKEGKIDASELNREAQLLKKWKSVIDEEARNNGQ